MTVAIVIIGKNEGERLVRCLNSAVAEGRMVVYVDSGSTDGSIEKAEGAGAHVISLDLSKPFTAARARNAGFEYLMSASAPDFVQFVDGDCEFVDGWFCAATRFLKANLKCAAVCGRRRERRPDANIYHSLADDEWNTPVGEAEACGGDVMIRASAFAQIGGYDPTLIAGEEPEMCVRLRDAGWSIHRLDHDMTLHDVDMTKISQWWKRAVRAGHAYAEVSMKHRASPNGIWFAEARRAFMWSSLLPIAVILGAIAHSLFFAILLLYPLQVARLSLRGMDFRHAILLVVGKFAECWGALKFMGRRLTGRRPQLIEYKSS